MPMASCDMILGMKWLSSIGETRDDWKNLTMSLQVDGKEVILRDDPSLNKTRVSLRSLWRQWTPEEEGYLIEYQGIEEPRSEEEIDPIIQEVLTDFAALFQEPIGLPQVRKQDHAPLF